MGVDRSNKALKWAATAVGVLLLAAGVGVGIWHYSVEGDDTASYITLAIAAVLLLAGWTLFDWGAGISRRRSGKEKDRS